MIERFMLLPEDEFRDYFNKKKIRNSFLYDLNILSSFIFVIYFNKTSPTDINQIEETALKNKFTFKRNLISGSLYLYLFIQLLLTTNFIKQLASADCAKFTFRIKKYV